MTEGTLHPTPRGRDVVLEQIRIVGLHLRREALAVALVLGVVTLMIAIDIARGRAGTWFDSDEWVPIALAAFFVPFAVWRGERRFEPAFLWTLPVDRRRLALARVFAGWVWMTAVLAVFAAWEIGLAVLSGVAGAETLPLFAFIGATAMYLLGSALVLGLRHPLRWLLAAAGVTFLVALLRETLDLDPHLSGLVAAVERAAAAWRTLPHLAQRTITTFLWTGAGLAALWAAVSRHRERRRH